MIAIGRSILTWLAPGRMAVRWGSKRSEADSNERMRIPVCEGVQYVCGCDVELCGCGVAWVAGRSTRGLSHTPRAGVASAAQSNAAFTQQRLVLLVLHVFVLFALALALVLALALALAPTTKTWPCAWSLATTLALALTANQRSKCGPARAQPQPQRHQQPSARDIWQFWSGARGQCGRGRRRQDVKGACNSPARLARSRRRGGGAPGRCRSRWSAHACQPGGTHDGKPTEGGRVAPATRQQILHAWPAATRRA